MNRRINDIVLPSEGFQELLHELNYPDEQYFELRDSVFQRMDDSMTIVHEGKDFIVDIPGIEFSPVKQNDVFSADVKRDDESEYSMSISKCVYDIIERFGIWGENMCFIDENMSTDIEYSVNMSIGVEYCDSKETEEKITMIINRSLIGVAA